MTALAASTAVRSDPCRYLVKPPPSCSFFHGRNGSSECAVKHVDVVESQMPARAVYQVCECMTVAALAALAITRSADKVDSAALALPSLGSGR